MIEGVLRHDTEMEIERQYVDSHGQSRWRSPSAGCSAFQLLPRLKAIAAQRLYLPEARSASRYPNLACILARTIDWDLIEQQYDEMVRYATAMAERTADPEAILRRFMRSNVQHPTYKALAELGKATKRLFLCRYLAFEGAPAGNPRRAERRRDAGTVPMGSSSSARAARLPATGSTTRKCRCMRCICCSPAWST